MSYLIKDLTGEEKPREKAKKYGVSALSDVNLLAIILRTGTKNSSAIDLAHELLKEYGSLTALEKARFTKLKAFKGIGEVKAITLLAALELGRRTTNPTETPKIQIKESKNVYEYFHSLFTFQSQEQFYVLFLDTKNYVLTKKLLFMGTVNQSMVHPRDVFREALLHNAVKILCIHNHPSGNVTPSIADEKITRELKRIGDMMGISLIDHVIIGKDTYYSFLEHRKDIWQ